MCNYFGMKIFTNRGQKFVCFGDNFKILELFPLRHRLKAAKISNIVKNNSAAKSLLKYLYLRKR